MKKFSLAVLVVLVLGTLAYIGCNKNRGVVEQVTNGVYDEVIKIGHVVGVCQGCMFCAHDQDYFEEEGLKVELVWTPHPNDAQTMLDAGELQVVHGPFTSFYRAVDQGADVRMIAGSGCQGVVIVATPESGIKSLDDLVAAKGKGLKVGTQRMNTLEIGWWSAISDRGLTYDDFDMKFFFDHFTLLTAFENGEIDICCHIEPYGTMMTDTMGGVRVADSPEFWGKNHPECVVSVNTDFLKKYPETLKKYIRAIKRGDDFIKADPKHAADELFKNQHYKVTHEVLVSALPRQPPMVDFRPNLHLMEKGANDMVKLGYLKEVPRDVIDTSLLEEVMEEMKKEKLGEVSSDSETNNESREPALSGSEN